MTFVQVTQDKRPLSTGPVIGIPNLRLVSLVGGSFEVD